MIIYLYSIKPCPSGECVPYYMCANGSIITDGEGLFDLRLGEDEETHPCKSFFKTCCTVQTDAPVIPPATINDGCGYRNLKGVGFSITGQTDNEAQFGK